MKADLTLKPYKLVAGCDEVGRGSLAGPVVAAAVILPENFCHCKLGDSKNLTAKIRNQLAKVIKKKAIDWAIGYVSSQKIDQINILQSSILAMHRALNKLVQKPQFILVDGNRFTPYKDIPHKCIIRGDSKFSCIAAASILAKTYRDDYMDYIDKKFPLYHWYKNKGYPTFLHKKVISQIDITPYHRKTFNCFTLA